MTLEGSCSSFSELLFYSLAKSLVFKSVSEARDWFSTHVLVIFVLLDSLSLHFSFYCI